MELNGSLDHRYKGNLNVSFAGVEGESLLQVVDLPRQVDGGGVLAAGWIVVVSDVPDPLYSVGKALPWLTFTPCR